MDNVDTTSSHWADLQPDVLVKVSADLSLLDNLHCEKVCTAWRQFAFFRVVGQTKRRTLAILDVPGRSQVCGDSTDSLVQLNISQHKEGLASWLSMRGAAFDVISFGTALHPAELSLEGWQFVLSAFVQDVQGTQLKLSVASMTIQPLFFLQKLWLLNLLCWTFNFFCTFCLGLDFILMPLDERLRQLCTALYIDHGPDHAVENLAGVSLLTSLQSLEIDLAMDDYMGYLPSCWTQLRHLHSLTLNKCKAVPTVLSILASLRSLAVRFISYPQYRLETLPQLTSLSISLDPSEFYKYGSPMFASLLLPKGNDVQLRQLTLKLNTQLENLQCATQLTRLDMAPAAAQSARRRWHAPLPNLKVINVLKAESEGLRMPISCPWSTVWQHSTMLERLALGGWCVEEIPDWVTNLQQLKSLDMPSAWLRRLKVGDLMQLPYLEQLNIGNCASQLVDNVKLAIVECAYLPVLKQFTYGFRNGYTGHAIMKTSNSWASSDSVLRQLQTAFVSHKYAPFHLRQWESTIHSDVTVFQFRCDD